MCRCSTTSSWCFVLIVQVTVFVQPTQAAKPTCHEQAYNVHIMSDIQDNYTTTTHALSQQGCHRPMDNNTHHLLIWRCSASFSHSGRLSCPVAAVVHNTTQHPPSHPSTLAHYVAHPATVDCTDTHVYTHTRCRGWCHSLINGQPSHD